MVNVGMWKTEQYPHAQNATHVCINEGRQWKSNVFPKAQEYWKFICFNYDDIKSLQK
jgi:hypothetical protein